MKTLNRLCSWYLGLSKRDKAPRDGWSVLYDHFMGEETASKIKVDRGAAMTLSAVYCAVRLISETVAGLPLKMYRKTDDGRDAIEEHAVLDLLEYNPNDEMTGFDLRQVMTQDALVTGNGYAEIIRQGTKPVELWHMEAEKTFPARKRKGGPLIYINRSATNEERILPADRVLHLKGLGDGISGRSVISLARESFGLALAAEKTGAAFFGNAAKPSGVLQHPGELGDDAERHLRKSWREMHQGSGNTGSVPILEEGMTWQPISIPPEDAQFLKTRQFSIGDVARWFGVPPPMLYDLERATFSNIEHQQMQFVMLTLMAWLIKWEKAIRWRLLTVDEARHEMIYAQHNVNGLLRGDIRTRHAAHKLGIDAGWKTRAEARRDEDLNTLPGLDKPLKPMNYETIGPDGKTEKNVKPEPASKTPDEPDDVDATEPTPPPPPAEDERAAEIIAAHLPALSYIADKMLRREAKAIRAAAKKGQGFAKWVETYYDRQRPQIVEQIAPAFSALAGSLLTIDSRGVTSPIAEAIEAAAWKCSHVHAAAAEVRLTTAAANSLPIGLTAVIGEIATEFETDDHARAELVEHWVETITDTLSTGAIQCSKT